jgi:hypothetical protein
LLHLAKTATVRSQFNKQHSMNLKIQFGYYDHSDVLANKHSAHTGVRHCTSDHPSCYG